LREAIMEGSVLRVRPMLMTALANIFGLMPVMVSTGTGADVMKRIAAPMVGGLASAVLLTLILVPVLYSIWKGRELRRIEPGS
jgi:Cu(I)/Ag(I) efflux system membrane protein CusA/SilA